MHLIVDNYCANKHARVRNWLAQRPRFPVLYTPTHASWLNQVERLFRIITQKAIRHGIFSGVKELIAKTAIRGHLQQKQDAVQLDGDGGLNPGEAHPLCSQISGTGH